MPQRPTLLASELEAPDDPIPQKHNKMDKRQDPTKRVSKSGIRRSYDMSNSEEEEATFEDPNRDFLWKDPGNKEGAKPTQLAQVRGLQSIDGSLMRHARLSCLNDNKACRYQNAKVGSNNSDNYWAPAPNDEKNSWLQVDLGSAALVHTVGVQGRFPATKVWPTAGMLESWGYESSGRQRYRGSMWNVVDESHEGYRQWTTRYELMVRGEGGHSWESLGEFNASSDMTTEATTSLIPVGNKGENGVVCRYLRFRPVAFKKAPAMRVAVYGIKIDKDSSPNSSPSSRKAMRKSPKRGSRFGNIED